MQKLQLAARLCLRLPHEGFFCACLCLLCSWPRPIRTNGVHLSHISFGAKWGRRPRTFSITFDSTDTRKINIQTKIDHTHSCAHTRTCGHGRQWDAWDAHFWVVTATGPLPTINLNLHNSPSSCTVYYTAVPPPLRASMPFIHSPPARREKQSHHVGEQTAACKDIFIAFSSAVTDAFGIWRATSEALSGNVAERSPTAIRCFRRHLSCPNTTYWEPRLWRILISCVELRAGAGKAPHARAQKTMVFKCLVCSLFALWSVYPHVVTHLAGAEQCYSGRLIRLRYSGCSPPCKQTFWLEMSSTRSNTAPP